MEQIEKFLTENNVENAIEKCVEKSWFIFARFLGGMVTDRGAPATTDRGASATTDRGASATTDRGAPATTDRGAPATTDRGASATTDRGASADQSKIPVVKSKKITVQLLCNWCSSKVIANLWRKMCKSPGTYSWNEIELVWEGTPDYYVIINAPPPSVVADVPPSVVAGAPPSVVAGAPPSVVADAPPDTMFEKKRTIIFRMEPNMSKHPELWGEFASPIDQEYLKVFRHENDLNNLEWHLSKTYTELLETSPQKKFDKILSTILSRKYNDIGQIKRIDFVKFLDKKEFPVDVYGSNHWNYSRYKGELPYHNKDDGILPYKYTFNCENNSIPNYLTEKLIDGILGECLTFYSGCPNVKEYIDERAYVYLELCNFQKDYELIQRAMDEDWYTQRLPYIKKAKKKILEEMQFFPRLEKCLRIPEKI